jgi:hypothetical protein
MITPSFALTATERVLPNMALDFTTAALDPRVTFTRSGNTATVTNSSGVIAAINADLPRFDFNPTTLVCNGLLIEEARTNLLLNSLINGVSLVTQLVTTTAVAHTLSFYGTGTIVLTGTSSATVVGTGAYPSRRTLTFTPTAGVLTVTVTGTVQFAQLEVGAFATSYIPTAASQVTRNADVATMTGTNFSDWYNATEGTFVASAQRYVQGVVGGLLLGAAQTGAFSNSMYVGNDAGAPTNLNVTVVSGGAVQASINRVTTVTSTFGSSFAYKVDNFGFATSGLAAGTDVSGILPASVDIFVIGSAPWSPGSTLWNGYVKKINYYPQRLTNAELQAFSK